MGVDPEFWHGRWRDGVTPWQQPHPNRMLVRHLHLLGLDEHALVLVPLCGKTVDMRWLLERRYQVLGVELSELAARSFFQENGLRYEQGAVAGFTRFSGDGVTLLCGDVFDLTPAHLAGVDAVYDRAALIAFDAPDRDRYVALLTERLPEGASQLLVTLAYDPSRMHGPPFAVPPDEVRSRYRHRYGVRLLDSVDVLDDEPRFRERGLDELTEHAFLLVDHRG